MKHRIKSMIMAVAMFAASILPASMPLTVNAEPLAGKTPTFQCSVVYGQPITIVAEGAVATTATAATTAWYCDHDDAQINTEGNGTKRPAPWNYTFSVDNGNATMYIPWAGEYDGDNKISAADWFAAHPMDPQVHRYKVGNALILLNILNPATVETSSFTVRSVTIPLGETINASELTLFKGNYPYYNFASLHFVDDSGNVTYSYIGKKKGTQNLKVAVEGLSDDNAKILTVAINVTDDSVPPTINSLYVKDGLADKWAVEKTIVVSATDDKALAADAYYWEITPTVATKIKEDIISGYTADQIGGLAWSDASTLTVSAEGTYTIFVRDKAGNIAYKDIVVRKISKSTPVIQSVNLGKNGSTAYFDVSASDSSGQPLFYKCNDGAWGTSPRVTGVVEGTNTIYVKNEAGTEVYTTKDVYLSVFLNAESALSPESLFNYITVSPSTWTRDSVNVMLVIPDTLAPKLGTSPISVNGEAFGTNRTYVATQPGESVVFIVKDAYGTTHTSSSYTVKNIDRTNPSISLETDEKGNITIQSQDLDSGIKSVAVSTASMKNYVIKTESTAGIGTNSTTYKAPANGSYSFTVTDFAGNAATATIAVSSIIDTNNVYNDPIPTSTVKPTRIGTSTSGRTGSSSIGTKINYSRPGSIVKNNVDPTTVIPNSYKGDDGNLYHEDGTPVSDEELEEAMATAVPVIEPSYMAEKREPGVVQKIEYIDDEAKLENGPIKFIESLQPDTTNQQKLTKALILSPIALLLACAAFLIGTGKLSFITKKFKKIR